MLVCEAEGHTFIGSYLTDRSVVLDLGANHGKFTAIIVNQFRCRSICVEANPKLQRSLQECGAHRVVEKAISGIGGSVAFCIHGNSESSTLLSDRGDDDRIETITVDAVPLEQLVCELSLDRLDLVKVDIEGAEIPMFDSCSDEFLKRVGQFTIEFHDFNGLIARSDAQRIVRRLQRLGFFCVNMWRTSYGDTLCINQRSLPLTTAQRFRLKYGTRNALILKRLWARMFGGPNSEHAAA